MEARPTFVVYASSQTLPKRFFSSFAGLACDVLVTLMTRFSAFSIPALAAPTRGISGVALGMFLFFSAGSSWAQDEKRSPKKAAAAKGYKLLKGTVSGDVNGDGKTQDIGACQKDKGIQVCLFGKNNKGAVLDQVLPPTGGTKLKKLKLVDLISRAGAPFISIEVYGETPDEKTKRIRLYSLRGGGKAREVFTAVIFRPKNKADRPKWESDKDIIKYGDAREGWYFSDIDDDGMKEVVVRRKPQIVTVKRSPRADARILTGVRESVYRWRGEPTKGKFIEEKKQRLNNFIDAMPIASITASDAWVEPSLLKELKAEAMTSAAVDAASGDANAKDPKIDMSPFIKVAADNNMDTAWIENKKGIGDGEWVEFKLKEKSSIHMIRVVTGCIKDKSTFRSHNVPIKFELKMGKYERAIVDRAHGKRPLTPIKAILEVPVKGRKFAKQTLIFFDGSYETDTVRLTLMKVRRMGKKNRSCISEVSIH
ncbi:MAG: hypothetical protein GY822_29415 [Deltaproteobacteria bacterium]|nr:hypothetical protein [Deltaproteobacteria bacterium]